MTDIIDTYFFHSTNVLRNLSFFIKYIEMNEMGIGWQEQDKKKQRNN